MILENLSKEELLKLLKPYYRECKSKKDPFVVGEFYRVYDHLFFSQIECNNGQLIQLESKEVGQIFK